MKKKLLVCMIAGALLTLSLTGCGDGSDSSRPEVPPSREAAAEPAQTEGAAPGSKIEEYEKKYASGEFTAEDYIALASLYQEAGYIKKQRDMLEQCSRLYDNQEAFDTLQGITVNIEEESGEIKEAAAQLQQNLSIAEYVNEGVGQLISPDWMSIMMPKMKEGKRSYYLKQDSGSDILTIQVGYDEGGKACTDVWYQSGENQICWISSSPDSVQLMNTSLEDGQYNGEYESWLVESQNSDVYHEKGTFNQGINVGSYTAEVRFGSAATDLFALWGTREDMDFTTYSGDFGTDGVTTVEQPEKSKVTNGGNGEDKIIVYAYDDKKENFLFLNESEAEPSAFVFTAAAMGMETLPVCAEYEPKAAEEASIQGSVDAGQVKVRIFDGNVEWYDGKVWHTAGSVTEYEKQDPFGDETAMQSGEDGNGSEIGNNAEGDNPSQPSGTTGQSGRGGGSVVKDPPKNTNTNTNKPAGNSGSNKPATPVTPPANNTPSTPPPADNNQGGGDDGGDNGGGDNGGGDSNQNNGGDSGGDHGGGDDNQNNGGDNGGNNGGGDGNQNNGGGDKDIEWTDDLL